jgi:hypothetical protein
MGTSKCSLACRECKSYAAHVAEMLSKKQRFHAAAPAECHDEASDQPARRLDRKAEQWPHTTEDYALVADEASAPADGLDRSVHGGKTLHQRTHDGAHDVDARGGWVHTGGTGVNVLKSSPPA